MIHLPLFRNDIENLEQALVDAMSYRAGPKATDIDKERYREYSALLKYVRENM